MTSKRFRELKIREEVFDAAVKVSSWGYPRALEEHDLHKSVWWFEYGDDVIFWMAPVEGIYAVLHIVVSPEGRGKQDHRRIFHVIEFLADLMGAKGVIASDCTLDGEVASYLQRLGWEVSEEVSALEDEVWFIRRLE
jgi:hypothetical protein